MGDRKSTRLNSSHSLHDALPIFLSFGRVKFRRKNSPLAGGFSAGPSRGNQIHWQPSQPDGRSEEHTSELQSLPTRRSSDLLILWQSEIPAEEQPARGRLFRRAVAGKPNPLAAIATRWEIGRAHV